MRRRHLLLFWLPSLVVFDMMAALPVSALTFFVVSGTGSVGVEVALVLVIGIVLLLHVPWIVSVALPGGGTPLGLAARGTRYARGHCGRPEAMLARLLPVVRWTRRTLKPGLRVVRSSASANGTHPPLKPFSSLPASHDPSPVHQRLLQQIRTLRYPASKGVEPWLDHPFPWLWN